MANSMKWVLTMFGLTSAAALAFAVEVTKQSGQLAKPDEKKTGYAEVNGLRMYYEITGNGAPAIYIHPVLSHSGLVPQLAPNRQWIAIDLQGHGRTADIDRPMTCEQHADDVAALLKQLKSTEPTFSATALGARLQ